MLLEWILAGGNIRGETTPPASAPRRGRPRRGRVTRRKRNHPETVRIAPDSETDQRTGYVRRPIANKRRAATRVGEVSVSDNRTRAFSQMLDVPAFADRLAPEGAARSAFEESSLSRERGPPAVASRGPLAPQRRPATPGRLEAAKHSARPPIVRRCAIGLDPGDRIVAQTLASRRSPGAPNRSSGAALADARLWAIGEAGPTALHGRPRRNGSAREVGPTIVKAVVYGPVAGRASRRKQGSHSGEHNGRSA